MGVEIDISTLKEKYFPGDTIEGTVQIKVTTNNEEGSPANELVLRLVGAAKTSAKYTKHENGSTHQHTANETDKIFSYDLQLASFGGKAVAGIHSFPFSVLLPLCSPPSMEEKGSRGGDCKIVYSLKARLHRPGLLKFDVKKKLKLIVLSRPQETGSAAPVVVGPETVTVRNCCINCGSMSLAFEVGRLVVRRNESIRLAVVAHNDSSISVESMRIELEQVTTWKARGHKDKKKRSIASVIVPGSELGDVQRSTGRDDQRGRSPAAVADAARQYLQELLASRGGTRLEILIPDDCLLTLKSTLIEVRHSLSVELNTPGFSSSPNVWTPLTVQPRA